MLLLPEEDSHYLLHQFHTVVMYVIMLLVNSGDYFHYSITDTLCWFDYKRLIFIIWNSEYAPLRFSLLDSGHHVMQLWPHHCLLRLSCSFVYILKAFMVCTKLLFFFFLS